MELMRKSLFLHAILILLSQGLSARHIIGGDFSYTCLSIDNRQNTFTISCTLKVYRDCYGGGALFDNPATIGIFRIEDPSNYTFISKEDAPLVSSRLLANNNPCVQVPGNVCVEEGVYIFRKTLPLSNKSYYISYQRCCRNETISNIILPGDQGAVYFMEITPDGQRLCNNSPKFKTFPPILICQGLPINYDHSVTDQEGDLVTYEFCSPFTAGGKAGSMEGPPGGSAMDCDGVTPDPIRCKPPFQTVQFRAPTYTRISPLGGSPAVILNPTNGLISGTPTTLGQFVVGVCIKEYRNGVLLSITQRDFQFNVINCVSNLDATVQADSVKLSGEFVINSCGKNTVTIINQSTQESFIKSYDWFFDINGQTQQFNTKDVTVSFPGPGTYRGKMFLNKADTQCNDSADISIKILPGLNADFSFQYDTCVAAPVAFTDLSISQAGTITDWKWTFEPGKSAPTKNSTHEFRTPGLKPVQLWIRDINGCRDSITKPISYFPVPALLVVEPSSFTGCQPLGVFFNNLSYPIDSSYQINWDFGDGQTSNSLSPTHIYDKAGLFDVRVNLISPIGCRTQASFANWIRVLESPEAAFSYNPQSFSSEEKTILIRDESKNAEFIKYLIDDRIPLFSANPSYEFRDTGIYKISQVVSRFNGCNDTAIAYIDVEPIVTYFMPNAFTPNGSGINETFYGVGYTGFMKDFSLTVWDRWGGQVYRGNDPLVGWNGKYENNGKDLPPGVYIYQAEYSKPRGERISLKGYVTLIR